MELNLEADVDFDRTVFLIKHGEIVESQLSMLVSAFAQGLQYKYIDIDRDVYYLDKSDQYDLIATMSSDLAASHAVKLLYLRDLEETDSFEWYGTHEEAEEALC